MPATLDGDPQEEIRLMVSTASTCHIFDFETYKRGKLHKEYPHMLNYVPYRPGVDNVSITSVYAPPGATPMTIHGTAAIPIIIDGYLYEVPDVFLVDTSPQVQGIFSGKFLADYKLQFSFTADGMQRVIPPPQ
ncbi:hypothetical protein BGZ97_006292 [Linnemannia gamsii]|uniref:Uncharacterized protein n=1 Tax=Linnemannia gamsii TaxID=64522 RepID=A0A9P6QRS7_9FUNG|nr:hypothetical protein BGZ97_006292 [Linnemannia gamsii]